MSMKNPLTPAEIEPATFPIVAQQLNHCATAVPVNRVRQRILCNLRKANSTFFCSANTARDKQALKKCEELLLS